jgi:hypothetical protein
VKERSWKHVTSLRNPAGLVFITYGQPSRLNVKSFRNQQSLARGAFAGTGVLQEKSSKSSEAQADCLH